MEVGILGLAGSGKTTLFSLLTGNAEALLAAGRRDQATVGMGRVPDPRLDRLSQLYPPAQDDAGDGSLRGRPGAEGRAHRGRLPEHPRATHHGCPDGGAAGLSQRRGAPPGWVSIDPFRDLERIEEELVLQDQIVVERRIERLRARPRQAKGRRSRRRARPAASAVWPVLEDGRPLRGESFEGPDRVRLKGFTFLSLKPILAVVNVDEADVGSDPCADERWAAGWSRPAPGCTSVSATLEREIAELDPADAAAFMAELGIADRALDRVAREAYRLLGLISFFTVGEDECRAWSIPPETAAVEAARAIHSDISRGFIRAEVVTHDELLTVGSLAGCRDRGSLRLEGKAYPVRDGDVVHYRFNV